MSDLRSGFTTGSCAAAAAKAAAYMLITGKDKNNIKITTPKGVIFDAKIVDIAKGKEWVSCAVIKDSGDDPDVTNGAYVYAKVSYRMDNDDRKVTIDGGLGVGRVTLPGLNQPVGAAAINSVPRSMIENEVLQVINLYDDSVKLSVVISVPEGIEIARKTFNPRLGIEGGISILGTSGIVEPMSEKALIDTIRVELTQKKEMGEKNVVIAPGNYGQDFIKKEFGYNLDRSVKCSNFIGQTLDIAAELSFERVLLVGHIGKLIKLSGGIMNTHSKEGDCRMELLSAAMLEAGADAELCRKILQCISTEQAISEINNLLVETMSIVLRKAMYYLNKRAGDRLKIDCIMYSTDKGVLAMSSDAKDLLI